MKLNERHVHTTVISITVALLLYYLFYRGRALFDLGTWNRIFAFGAVFLLGLSFLLGPLNYFWPRLFAVELHHRKALGLWGFFFVSAHILISFFIARDEMLRHPWSMSFAIVAFLIFIIMAITSTAYWVQRLGYARWKSVQRTGYLAFFLVLLHVGILEIGEITEHPLIPIAFVFMILVLLARIIIFLSRMARH